jgi:hypothetical protein
MASDAYLYEDSFSLHIQDPDKTLQKFKWHNLNTVTVIEGTGGVLSLFALTAKRN